MLSGTTPNSPIGLDLWEGGTDGRMRMDTRESAHDGHFGMDWMGQSFSSIKQL